MHFQFDFDSMHSAKFSGFNSSSFHVVRVLVFLFRCTVQFCFLYCPCHSVFMCIVAIIYRYMSRFYSNIHAVSHSGRVIFLCVSPLLKEPTINTVQYDTRKTNKQLVDTRKTNKKHDAQQRQRQQRQQRQQRRQQQLCQQTTTITAKTTTTITKRQ